MVRSQTTSITSATHAASHIHGGTDPLLGDVRSTFVYPHNTTHEGGGADVISGVVGVDTPDTGVFNGTSPTAYTDLDLSAVCGTHKSLVVLRFTSASNYDVAVRRNGDASDYFTSPPNEQGVQNGHGVANESTVLTCMTDSSGIIEWITSAGVTVVITVIGYIALQ